MANHRQPTKREHALIDVIRLSQSVNHQHMLWFDHGSKEISEKEVKAHKATKDQLEKVEAELKAVQKQLTAAKESYDC